MTRERNIMKSSKHPRTQNHNRAFSPGFPHLVMIVGLALFLSAGIYALKPYTTGRGDSAAATDTTNESRSFELKEIRSGWWETSDYIYFDIPARIVFHLPETDARIDPEILSRKIWDEFERVGNIFNPFDPRSETGRLNNNRTRDPISVSNDMYHVLRLSKKLWEASDGAFDPTMLPVKELWHDAAETQEIPPNRDIRRTVAQVGFDKVTLLEDRQALKRENKNIRFDFGGIAKGYAVDKAAAVIRAHGIDAALISLGGEIRTFGKNDNRPWRIGIQHPTDMDAIWGTVSSDTGITVSTSGNYRQPLLIAGQEFYHIFHPQTGRPVSEKVLGVTTLCTSQTASNALLDGAATAITVLGADRGVAFAETIGIDALVLKRPRGGTIEEIMTDGFNTHYDPRPQ